MRKWIIFAALSLVLIGMTPSAYAHITGAFGNYLANPNEDATERLKEEMQKAKEEIERLNPQANQLKIEFENKTELIKNKVVYYNSNGIDMYMNVVLQSKNVVDAMANKRIIEKKLVKDLQELEQLYVEYLPIKLVKDSLQGYDKLLKIIQGNLEARDKVLDEVLAGQIKTKSKTMLDRLDQLFPVDPTQWLGLNEKKNTDELSRVLDEIWSTNLGYLLELSEDSQLINNQISTFITQKSHNAPFRFEENRLNSKAKLTYFFRPDHIYIHLNRILYGANVEADLILIGAIKKTNDETISLQIEAGFLNGFPLPAKKIESLKGFELKYSQLNPYSTGFYVEQTNGTIIIQPIEQKGE